MRDRPSPSPPIVIHFSPTKQFTRSSSTAGTSSTLASDATHAGFVLPVLRGGIRHRRGRRLVLSMIAPSGDSEPIVYLSRLVTFGLTSWLSFKRTGLGIQERKVDIL